MHLSWLDACPIQIECSQIEQKNSRLYYYRHCASKCKCIGIFRSQSSQHLCNGITSSESQLTAHALPVLPAKGIKVYKRFQTNQTTGNKEDGNQQGTLGTLGAKGQSYLNIDLKMVPKL